ncbi:MAG: DUF4142 domain-containing protein [Chitinophagales bacterium]|nr:DUF4142 domain-containing protein [Chitinophagales bacterium]
MKSAFKMLNLYVFLFAGLLSFTSCQNTMKKDESKDMAEDQNKDKFDKNNEKNAQLMVDLVSNQYYEIHLAQYAQQKSTNSEIKSLATMMVDDHTAMLNQLKSLAAQKTISIPNEDSTDVNNKTHDWNNDKPNDFNKAWTNEMIDNHKDAVNKMQGAIDDNDTDIDLKNILTNGITKVRMHLDSLNVCHDKLDKMKS